MLLSFVDRSTASAGTAVEIYLEKDGVTDSFVTDYDIALPSDALRRSLRWYYADYLQELRHTNEGDSVVRRLLEYGETLGNELCGSFHELDRFLKDIEAAGYAQVDVELVSSHASFWSRPWETLILPGARYLFSGAARSFVRRLASGDLSREPELRYELQMPRNEPAALTGLLQGQSPQPSDPPARQEEKPLRVLYVVSRPRTASEAATPSLAFDASCNALATEGALTYEVWSAGGWDEIAERLASADRPVHVLHFDGPIVLSESSASLVLCSNVREAMPVDVNVVARTLAQFNVALLTVDCRGYRSGESAVPGHEGLLKVAESALRAGVRNVLGLGEICDPWTGGECLWEVYKFCVRGLSLGQAVVEARKALQSKKEVARFTARAVPFHAWPLLIHYGGRPVTFFSAPQAVIAAHESRKARQLGQKLLGFRRQMLPPELSESADGPLWEVIDHITREAESRRPAAVRLTGAPGTGKTHLAHRICWHLACVGYIEHGFYFDFGSDVYSSSDILSMIAPALSLAPGDAGTVRESLRRGRCSFVLDGLAEARQRASATDLAAFDELERLLAELSGEGHIVLVLDRSAAWQPDLPFRQWLVEPLGTLEQRALAARVLRMQKLEHIEEDESWPALLTGLRGNAWLTTKSLPLLHSRPPRELIRHLEEKLSAARPASLVDDFFGWQWNEMPPHCRRLLQMYAELEGVYVELLSVGCGPEEAFQPARALMAAAGDAQAKFAEVIRSWERSGFLVNASHGRLLDTQALTFLRASGEAPSLHDESSLLAFSQWVCEGVRLVTRGVLARPSTPQFHHLLVNRRQWVPHFERLWFAADFTGFIAVLQAFEELMKQVRLERETAAWLLDLLARSSVASPEGAALEAQMSWLALAGKTLVLEEALTSTAVAEGAQIWWTWLQQGADLVSGSEIVRFRQAVRFMEIYYQRLGEWRRCVALCEKLCPVLTRHQLWQPLTQTLQSLARYQLELRDEAAAYAAESRILNEIPYEDAPAGVREQSMLGVLAARVSRGLDEQMLLDLLRELNGERSTLEHVLDSLQADIYRRQERYAEALPYYCKLWERALSAGQAARLEELKTKFADLQDKFGRNNLDLYLDIHLPKEVIRPTSYRSVSALT